MHLILKHCRLILYADDSILHVEARTIEEATTKLNEDLHAVANYCTENKLVINTKKSKVMVFHKAKNIADTNVLLNGERLEVVSDFKYLGYHIDNSQV